MGKASFLPPAGTKKNNPARKTLTPLSLHELEIDWNNSRDIQRIRETTLLSPQHSLKTNPLKNAIALFLSEFLHRLIKEEQPDPPLFRYIFNSINILESTTHGIANFHLAFLIGLLPKIGLVPQSITYSKGAYFDMKEGIFTIAPPIHTGRLSLKESRYLNLLLRINYENMSHFTFSRQERIEIIDKIITYYRLHIPHLPELKSLPVLKSIFD
jgi:DNA repair protein RecO (recombination protein O)